ncbi:MAG: tripartite tricarboxylate transporter substrate-binding protein [Xanthobacteraceae bacterium]|jgi:tripartite-type tricarboxylate transporter receptor subunit TctC
MLARLVIGIFGVTLVGALVASADESWPNRPIRMVVPVAAGGGVDTMARIMATPLSQALGQSVVVEDIGGAGGAIGANTVAKADPDGYTLLFAGPGQAALPALHRHLAYDTEKDFAGVSLVAQFPLVLVVNPNVPANNLAEFVALLKANPGKYTFGSSGVGGSSHIPVELFKRLAGIDVLHVPFRGNSESSAALVSGQIDMIIDGLAPQLGNIKAGRVRPLGVTTLKRSSFLPDVPAISEVLPGYEYPMWVAVFAPAKTPVAIVDKLSAKIGAAVGAAETKKRYNDINVDPVGSAPAQLDQFFKKQVEFNQDIVTDAHIQPID